MSVIFEHDRVGVTVLLFKNNYSPLLSMLNVPKSMFSVK